MSSTQLKGLPAQIVAYMRGKDWFAKGTLTADIVWKHQRGKYAGTRYLPETVGRALRLLEEKKYIAVKPCGMSVQYKHIPQELRWRYIPFSSRKQGEEETLFRKD